MRESADRFKNNQRVGPRPEPAGPGGAVKEKRMPPRRKRRALRFKLLAGLLFLTAVFFLSPLFKVRSVQVEGARYSDASALTKTARGAIGHHILLYGKQQLARAALSDPYIKEASISSDLRGTLRIELTEHVPEYALVSNGQVHLIDRFGRVLGSGIVIPEGMTRLIDDTPPLAPGFTMYGDGAKKSILTSYQEIMEHNTSAIRFQSIRITDPNNIVLEHNGSTVELGRARDLKLRLNRAINILKADPGKGGPVTIDLRFDTAPVIRLKGET